MQPQTEKLNKLNGKRSLNDLKDTLTDVRENLADVDFERGYNIATKAVRQAGTVAYKAAKKNPMYLAIGVAGLGLLAGAYLFATRSKRD